MLTCLPSWSAWITTEPPTRVACGRSTSRDQAIAPTIPATTNQTSTSRTSRTMSEALERRAGGGVVGGCGTAVSVAVSVAESVAESEPMSAEGSSEEVLIRGTPDRAGA